MKRRSCRVINYKRDRWSCSCAVWNNVKVMVKRSVGCPIICRSIDDRLRIEFYCPLMDFSSYCSSLSSILFYFLGEWFCVYFFTSHLYSQVFNFQPIRLSFFVVLTICILFEPSLQCVLFAYIHNKYQEKKKKIKTFFIFAKFNFINNLRLLLINKK